MRKINHFGVVEDMRMPALTFQGKAINFSVNYDGITLYPKESSDPSVKSTILVRLKQVAKACHKLVIAPELLCSIKDVSDDTDSIQRCVFREDDDHEIYHRDNYKKDDLHVHVKFKTMLTREKIKNFLDILIRYSFLSEIESMAFLSAYDQRYATAKTILEKKLINDKIKDTIEIIREIKNSTDNDIIAQLHKRLLSKDFDYIRERTTVTSDASSVCNGTDAKGNIVPTSCAWAMIEESITLQMAENVRRDCARFTKRLAKAFDEECKETHPFFGINHFCPLPLTTLSVSEKYHMLFKDDKQFPQIVKQHFQALDVTIPSTPRANPISKKSADRTCLTVVRNLARVFNFFHTSSVENAKVYPSKKCVTSLQP